MKLLRLIPIYTAAMALTLVQALPAFQAEPVTGTVTKTEKKARKAKKSTESTGEMTEKSGATTSEATPMTETPAPRKGKVATQGSAQRAATTVSESDIAAAKASGKVWVNTSTGVYHKDTDRWYGKTKQGKFMTEQEAIKAGYRASKGK
jgi:hypothetical protein